MKWNKDDLERYIHAKEYVDTLIVPLIPFQLARDTDLTKDAFQSEVISIFLNELEKELTGRIMLIPSCNYLKKGNKSTEIDRINLFINDAREQPFEHVFFVTSDPIWKKAEKELDGELIWIPISNTGNIHSKEMHTLIRTQVEQVCELIRSYW